MADDDVYIKFASHRARTCALRLLDRKPQAYWSLRRNTGKGVYRVTRAELAIIAQDSRASCTILRRPYDDLIGCW